MTRLKNSLLRGGHKTKLRLFLFTHFIYFFSWTVFGIQYTTCMVVPLYRYKLTIANEYTHYKRISCFKYIYGLSGLYTVNYISIFTALRFSPVFFKGKSTVNILV